MSSPQHPLDPLTKAEIEAAVSIIRLEYKRVLFNTITLLEPPKVDVLKWWANPTTATLPNRMADVVVVDYQGKVFDGHVDLTQKKIVAWAHTPDVQPLITNEDLQEVEIIIRSSPEVIEQCKILGITDMSKVYCDAWAIGYDERFGVNVRLQQALMYYRPYADANQYTYPLDFCPIFDVNQKKVIHIDIPEKRRPLSTAPRSDYFPSADNADLYRTDLKPIHITQPQGVSFSVNGNLVKWQNWSIHVGFNHREGIVLNHITYFDRDENGGTTRPIFYRLSLAEMVVPYGEPERPHHRKHAFDLGEYGGGHMTNSLSLGCDCKGSIYYFDMDLVSRAGSVNTIKNAICMHEEDEGILYKHTDFRDGSTITTRARKLIISQIFTAANYEYCIYWIFHQDGTVQLEIKLTGILNTYAMLEDEPTRGYGTQVHPGVNAHNHQHLFCLRIDPHIDGQNNTISVVDAVPSDHPVGSKENYYGNAFLARKKKFCTPRESVTDYDGNTSRTWEMCNENKLNPYSQKPVAYKLVSREVPGLLPKENSLVWKRAGFARHAVHVTKYEDNQFHPAGRHVPQTSGTPSMGLPQWIAEHPNVKIDNSDVVLWHTFGITHFPTPEDFPIMPAEPMTLLLRPRNFFRRNPVLDVPPSFARTPRQVVQGAESYQGKEADSVAV